MLGWRRSRSRERQRRKDGDRLAERTFSRRTFLAAASVAVPTLVGGGSAVRALGDVTAPSANCSPLVNGPYMAGSFIMGESIIQGMPQPFS